MPPCPLRAPWSRGQRGADGTCVTCSGPRNLEIQTRMQGEAGASQPRPWGCRDTVLGAALGMWMFFSTSVLQQHLLSPQVVTTQKSPQRWPSVP